MFYEFIKRILSLFPNSFNKFNNSRARMLDSFNDYFESKKDDKDQETIPQLTQDTTWESNKNTINITNKSQEVSPFPVGDHKAAINRRERMRNTRHKNHK